jgi:prepilin-type N-terminal cleavage/methylation domain-containing protein
MKKMKVCLKRFFSVIRGQSGFTLVEMIVVTAVFIMVIIIAGDAFKTILTHSNILTRSEESNIEGMLGLEMFRHDLNQAGFALPWSFSGGTVPTYLEAADAPASTFNDAPSGVPRAFLAGDNLAAASSGQPDQVDYLSLKGTPLARNDASQRWTYVNYSSSGSSKPKIWSAENLKDNDWVVVMRRSFTENGYVNQLVVPSVSEFSTQFKASGFDNPSFSPVIPQETFYVYGIGTVKPRMPFNRTDYFVKRPAAADIPTKCADNTGVLYKATVNHADGKLTEIPIMDCVADMQVVFGWDMNEDGVVDAFSNADGTTVNGGDTTAVKNTIADAELLRNRLKIVKVYLLAQEGSRDPNYRNQKDIDVGNRSLGEISVTKSYTVADITAKNWTNYRWKVYRIVVSPKNLTLK